MEIAKSIQQKLQENQLFTIAELKAKFNELVKIIKITAEKEFQLMEFYDNFIRAKQLKIENLQIQQTGMNEMLQNSLQLCVEKIELSQKYTLNKQLQCIQEQNQLSIELHNAIIKVAHIHEQMRQNRLRLVADMVQQLEKYGVLQYEVKPKQETKVEVK